MTNLLLATLVLLPAPTDSWELKSPFKEKLSQEHEVLILIDAGGMEMDVELVSKLEIDKKTDKGFSGSFGFEDIYVSGEPQDGGTWPSVFGSNGVLMSMEADEGPGMRRMFLPFFMAYPDKAVSVGDTWKYTDKEDDAVDGHRIVLEYKVLEESKVGEKPALKIEFKLKEEGDAPMTGSGHYYLGKDGSILKYKMNVDSWPVPIAGQVFNAEITGELID